MPIALPLYNAIEGVLGVIRMGDMFPRIPLVHMTAQHPFRSSQVMSSDNVTQLPGRPGDEQASSIYLFVQGKINFNPYSLSLNWWWSDAAQKFVLNILRSQKLNSIRWL